MAEFDGQEEEEVLPESTDGLPMDPKELADLEFNPALAEARANRDKELGLTSLSQGITDIGASLASQGKIRANSGVFDAARKEAELKATDAQKDALSNRQIMMARLKAQEAAKRQAINDGFTREKIDAMVDQNAAIRGERKEKQIRDDVSDAGKALAPLQDLNSSIASVDAALGAPVDTLVVKDGNLYQPDGKTKLDLPGTSVPGVGRVSFYSGAARNLQGAIAGVFNRELKDRAGATVTNPEMERLRQEWGNGKFNTEAEMVGALQRFKSLAAQALKNREASFSHEVVDRYRKQGGKTSKDFETSGAKPQTKVVNGKTYQKVPGGWQVVP